jgi:hypothetical protein
LSGQATPQTGRLMLAQEGLMTADQGLETPPAPSDYTLGNQRFSGATNQPVATGQASAASGPNVGSFEDYVIRSFGDNPTPQQIAQARKVYMQADDRPVAAGASGPTPTAALNATRQLRNDFVRETASARTVQQQLALMKSSLQAVQQGREAPGSQGVLVTFQKILDPTSVVRESEYARSASGLSLLQNLEGRMMRITQGGAGVTPAQLAEFVQLAEQFANNQARFANETKGQIDAMASKFGLDPALITREFDAGQGAPAAPAATGAPKQGDTKTFPNGKRAVFDGKGWVQQ